VRLTSGTADLFPALRKIERMADRVFESLPSVPDHPALEQEVLGWWEREGIFDRLRQQNAEGPTWSFIDGPMTANNPMGVHHAWGRTLKDVFQRYKALRGYRQHYQNGFDCQGLWVEVEVEKALGMNSKREIEEYGLAEFAAKCRERVAH
jgi:isoleucyl-tRNA synthetase